MFPAVLVAVLIIITAAYIRLVFVMSQNRAVYDALPEGTSLIFQFNNPPNAFEKLSGSAFHPYLKEAPFFKKLVAQLSGIDAFMKKAAADNNFSAGDNSLLLAAISITGRDEYDYLYVFRKKHFTKEQFQRLMNAESGISLSRRMYANETIYEGDAEGVGKCSFVFLNGLFIASYVPALAEMAVTQLREGTSILEDRSFREVTELAGEDADVVVYLDLPGLAKFEPFLVTDEQTGFFQAISGLGNWMELDVKMKNNALMINGYTATGKDKKLLAGFKTEPSTQVEIIRAVPYNTALFFYYAVSDFASYLKGAGRAFTSEMENFQNWISNEWCFGLLEPLDEHFENDVFLVVRAADPLIAAQSLAERARLSGNDLNLEEFKQYPIGQLSLQGELNDLFDHHFLKISEPYYTVIDDYVVFANDLSVIKTVLQYYEEGQTLRTDPDYMVFERNLTTTSNFYVYFNTTRSVEVLKRLLSNALVSDIRKGGKGFVKFSPIALQFNRYEDIFFTSGCIQFSMQAEGLSNRFWQVKLDAAPAGAPAFVINHYTGEKEILIQDSLNNVYLITKSGKILWKRKLDSQIMSEIYLIDFFENSKLQFAFNTKGKVYIIDRKGENVADYPIRLPADASNGMLLVDYDRKKDYRIFVACSNGNVYGYYKSGKPLPGWSPQSKVGLVKFPMKHVTVEGKDFLIAANEAGEIYFFNRKGERRVKPVKLGKPFVSDFQVRTSQNNFQLINADHENNIFKVYRNGSFSSQKQEAIPRRFFGFFSADLNADGSYEMIFVDSLVAKVFNERYAEETSLVFPEKIDRAFLIREGGIRGIGFLSRSGQKIYYAGSDYKLNTSFPLESCTPFITADLFDTGRKVVIAVDCRGWVNAYQVK